MLATLCFRKACLFDSFAMPGPLRLIGWPVCAGTWSKVARTKPALLLNRKLGPRMFDMLP